MDAISDPSCEEVVIMSSAQVGKTEILNNIVGYFISQDACPILALQPTLEMAESWSKDRLAPMLRDTPVLKGKVKDARARDSGNTLRHKTFPGGHITMAGANSPASLASRPIRVLLADEVDRYPPSAGTEGDPVSLGWKRTTTFWNRKRVMTSTPTVKGISRIESAYAITTREHYHVPCPTCGTAQILRWSQVKWEKDSASADKPDLSTVHYECEHCQEQWTDTGRWSALQDGHWEAEDPTARARGFHLNEIYSPWVQLSDMVAAFYDAKRSPETLKTWINTSLGETWEEAGDKVDHSVLYDTRREDYPTLPERVLVLTAGVDVQKDRLEVEVVAWARDLECWSVRYERLYGDPLRPEVWGNLDDLLAEDYPHESGVQLKVSGTCVDTGGHHTNQVYAYCKPRWNTRVFAIKGRGGMGLPTIVTSSRNNRHKVRLFTLGVDTLKSNLYGRLGVNSPGPGYCHFPREYDEDYFMGLTSEKATTRYVHGYPTILWVKDAGVPNEPLDCRVYATATLDILRPPWSQLEARLTKSDQNLEEQVDSEEFAPKDAVPVPARRPARRPRKGGSGWVTKW